MKNELNIFLTDNLNYSASHFYKGKSPPLLQNMSHPVVRPFLFLVSSHMPPFELLFGGVVSPAGVAVSSYFVLWAVPQGNAY